MPVEMKMWRIDGDDPRPLASAVLPSEATLEDFLEKDPSMLGDRLLVIGRQVRTPYNKYIDLLAIDADGDLHVLELKRDRTSREVAAQVLDYGSWVSTLVRDDVRDIATQHLDRPLEMAFEEAFGDSLPDELNGAQQLSIVATSLDSSSERIVRYLRGYGVPINAVFFAFLEDEGRGYLARSWLVDDQDTDSGAAPRKKGKRAAWNRVDWYTAFGGSLGRVWEDGHKFGFISAGGGPRYSGKLRRIPAGDRVNVYVPGHGYVAVGTTLAEATRFSQAKVLRDDEWVRLADQPLTGNYEYGTPEGPEDDEIAEWVIPVDWIDARPVSDAFWETGMFANPNPVCELRQEFTLERLAQHFGLTED